MLMTSTLTASLLVIELAVISDIIHYKNPAHAAVSSPTLFAECYYEIVHYNADKVLLF